MERDYVEVRLESDGFDTSRVQVFSLAGREAISELFRFEVGIVTPDSEEPNAETMSGADATIVFSRGDVELRRIHGMIAEVEETLETEVEHRTYRLSFVPRAFRLTLVETQEIYMDMSVPDIIRQKLELVGFSADDMAFRLIGDYPKLEFVVQYKESDLAFVSRLAEHAGISFFFEHDERDRIIFADQNAGFHKEPLELPFRRRGEERDVFALRATTRLIPSVYVVQDYNYRKPQLDLTGSVPIASGFGGGVVEYGAHVKTPEDAVKLAQIRAEERACTRHGYAGESAAPAMAAGAKLKLEGHPQLDGVALLVTEVEHALEQPTLTHGVKKGASYRNKLRALDASLPFRPARRTPRPKIHGVITGVVEQDPAAPVGNYAQIDGEGRYTVKFIFDTAPPGERKASRPVRMVQPHAGPGYGMHFPLKPGIEVLLTFVDGDPDRPLIVGAVPNAETPSPVTRSNSLANQLKTASGVLIEMKDL